MLGKIALRKLARVKKVLPELYEDPTFSKFSLLDPKSIFDGVLVLIYYFKKQFKACLFVLFQDILLHFKFVNWTQLVSRALEKSLGLI